MLQILQSGLNVYWYRRHQPVVPARDICRDLRQPCDHDHSLRLENLASAFLILGVGLTLSTAAFLLEMAHHGWAKRSN